MGARENSGREGKGWKLGVLKGWEAGEIGGNYSTMINISEQKEEEREEDKKKRREV